MIKETKQNEFTNSDSIINAKISKNGFEITRVMPKCICGHSHLTWIGKEDGGEEQVNLNECCFCKCENYKDREQHK